MALGLALRLHAPDLVHFNIDESLASAVASQIATGHRFPLAGIRTSFGFHNPPLFLYLLAPFFVLSRDPLLAQAVLGIAGGAAAVVLVWKAAREWTGRALGGLIAAAIVALCPNAVEHSRRLWGHDTMVFWSALAAWGSVMAVRRQRAAYLGVSFVAAGAAQCCHLSGAVLWLAGLPVLLRRVGRPPGAWRALAGGAGFLALNYTPWLVDQARNDFAEFRHLAAVVAGGDAGRDLGVPVQALPAWLLVLADFASNDLLGAKRPWMVSPVAGAAAAALSLLAVALLVGALIRLAHLVRTNTCQERSLALALLLPALATPLLFGILMRAAVPPYQLPALVPLAVGAAGALTVLTERIGRRMVLVALGLWGAASVVLIAEVRSALARGEGDAPSLREKIALVAALRDAVGPDPFVLVQDGRTADAGLDVAWVYLLYRARLDGDRGSGGRAGPRLFVVHTETVKLRPQVAMMLRRMPVVAATPHGELREVPSGERGAWMTLVQRFPSGRSGSR